MKDVPTLSIFRRNLLQETHTTRCAYAAYSKIFSRMGLDFRAVQADTGSIGGSASHEFQVLAQSGEDDVIFSDSSTLRGKHRVCGSCCAERVACSRHPGDYPARYAER
ncbi:hypothetical protein MJ588_05780 [Klebsiella pneumoniae]|nr:hypothetical protein MJ588_05780 [Klebsiella pneumoniae]